MNRVLLLTGTSSGIGLHTAVQAARAGWTVVATLRDPDTAEPLRTAAAAAGVELDVRRLDVTDPAGIDQCVSDVVSTHGRIDAVINNAGWAATLPTIEQCSMTDYRAGFEVNFFGVVQVTRAVMPHLRRTGGRLITVGSTRGLIAQPFNECYSAAKFAVEGFLESLAPTAKAMGVDVVIVEPGPVIGTDFGAKSGQTRDSMLSAAGDYATVMESYLDWFADAGFPGAQTAEELADLLVEVLDRPEPGFRIMSSNWATQFALRKLIEPEGERILAMTSAWVAGDRNVGP